MKVLKIIGSIIISLMLVTCQKDKQVIEDLFDENKDIRVLRVEYVYTDSPTDENPDLYQNNVHYTYNSDNYLTNIKNGTYNRADISYKKENIHILAGENDRYWQYSDVLYSPNGKIENIRVMTPAFFYPYLKYEGELKFLRNNLNKIIEISMSESSSYYPLLSKITSYNDFGLPETSAYIPNIGDSIYPEDTINHLEFNFEYTKGEDIPQKLKRLINEELLFLNRYGITNRDVMYLRNKYFNESEWGEGNWLVSFGLPQYYILEERSSHIVSKRTTKHYKINEGGELEHIKTTVEDFPYVHDAQARTLEIAGLKIWYEFVE